MRSFVSHICLIFVVVALPHAPLFAQQAEVNPNLDSNVVELIDARVKLWEYYESNSNTAKLENGQLVLNSFSESGVSRYVEHPISKPYYEIELTMAIPDKKGAVPIRGLLFDFMDWNNYGYFIIRDGYYAIGFVQKGIKRKIADYVASESISIEGENRLHIKNDASRFTFSINGQKAHALKSRKIEFDHIGVVIGGEGEARFNSLTIKEFYSGN